MSECRARSTPWYKVSPGYPGSDYRMWPGDAQLKLNLNGARARWWEARRAKPENPGLQWEWRGWP